MKVALLALAVIAGAAPALAQTPLTLEEAMARAQDATPDAKVLTALVAEADARVRQAKAAFLPRVDLTETVQRGNQPVFVFGSSLAQRRFTEAQFAVASLNDPDPITNTRTAFAMAQPVFDAGATRLGVRTAVLGRDVVAAMRTEARQDLAVRAARAFVGVLQLEAAVRAADAALEAAESDRQRARARREVGVATDADVLAVDVHLADMQQRRIAAVGDLAVARIQLADVVGLPLNAAITLAPPVPRTTPLDGDALVRASAGHPQRRQAALQQQLADTTRRSARAALWPSLTVQAGWESNGPTFGEQRASWVLGAEVRVNVFKGLADRARLAEAGHAEARADAERERTGRRLDVEIHAAIAQLQAARAREDAGRTALAQAREAQRIVRDRYDSGLATVTDVLRAAEAALNAESRTTAAQMDVILRTVALDRAVGRL